MNNLNAGRVAYLDILRFIATFGVILIHITSSGYTFPIYNKGWFISVVGNSLVRWSVPVFVMISGALFLNPYKKVTIKGILKKNVTRLLTAYIFWYVTYVLLKTIRANILSESLSFDELIAPEYHLWFLPMLAGVYLLIPILRIVSENKKLLDYSLLLWGGYVFISFVMDWNIPQISGLFKMNIIIGYGGYFLLGHYLFSHDFTRRTKSILYLLGFLGTIITILGSLVMLTIDGDSHVKYSEYLSPNVALMAIAVFMLVKTYTSKIELNRIMHIIDYSRKELFGIYLTHYMFIYVLNKYYFPSLYQNVITLLLLVSLVFILSLFTTKLMLTIPCLRNFVK
jgi:surface polysaccharide O-acyltransferase-like enzyme